jgi:transposase-like protein
MAGANEPRKRRQYTAEERATVLAAVKEVGVVEAGRANGVPQTTVSTWIRDHAAKDAAVAPSALVTETTAPTKKRAKASKAAEPIAETKRRPARRYTPSEKAGVLEHAAAHGVSAAHEKFGVSRFTIYEWQRKLAKAAKGEGPSPTSGPAPSEIEAKRDAEIVGEWKKHPGLGRVRSGTSCAAAASRSRPRRRGT